VPDPFDLTGKVALVTGASTGIGQGVAVALAAAGADIAAAGRSEAGETRRQVEELGRRFLAIDADFSSIEPVQRVTEEAVCGFGRIDILVNNAGVIRRGDSIDFTEADWDAVIDTNLKTAFFLTQAVARHMLARGGGGKIINIASLLSFQGGIRVPSYTASKSGLAGLTRILANEWAKRGLNVNAIAPGYVETGNTAPLRADPVRSQEILGRIPAGRWGRPSDLGGAAVFLASAASDYVHGVVLPVDGGWMAR